MSHQFNPRFHPRGPDGKFIKTLSSDFSSLSRPLSGLSPSSNAVGRGSKALVRIAPKQQVIYDHTPIDIPSSKTGHGIKGRIGPAKIGVRANINSATASVGRDIRVAPNVNLHVAALARLEKKSEKESYLHKLTTRQLVKLTQYIPNNRLQQQAENLIRERRTHVGRVGVSVPSQKKTPTTVNFSNSAGRRAANSSGSPLTGQKLRK